MPEDERPVVPPHVPFWDRPATRRAILAGTATAAAAGTAAVIVGVARRGGGADDEASTGADAVAGTSRASATATPDLSAKQIADPRRRAAHLLRRAGFGGTPAEIDAFAKLGREDAADRLLNFQAIDNSGLEARIQSAGLADLSTMKPGDGNRWWITRMVYTARPLEERMTFIWHGLLTTQVSKIGGQRFKLMLIQNALFRENPLPKYDDLLKAVSKDPAMLFYLDTAESTKEHPNENYARELMELFSMGVGNYTETDVRESARAFTGWRVTMPERPAEPKANLTEEERRKLLDQAYAAWEPKFYVQQRFHDSGAKTFLGKTGTWDGDDIVDIIMSQPATGRYICTRLFMEFANYNPDARTTDRLVKVWDSSGHQVRDVVREVLISDEFYSEASYRGFVRGPIEFVAGAIRGLELDLATIQASGAGGPNARQADSFRGMDQVLFEPPSVAGWPGGETWLSSSTFFARMNYLDSFLFPRGRPIKIPVLAAAASPEQMVDVALDRLVDSNVTDATRQAIYEYARGVKNVDERAAGVAYLVLASPEYQLT